MEAMTTDTANADIRAVFFDIDGTLTSFTTHTVPDSTIEAIHRLQAAGVKVLICTGRAPSQMHVVLDTMPVTFDGVVAFNGQYCFDDTGFFASQALDTADIEVILDWLDRHPDVVCNFGEKDYVYFNQSNDLLRATWSKLGKPHRPGISRTRAPARWIMRLSRSVPLLGPSWRPTGGTVQQCARGALASGFHGSDSGRWRQAARHPAVHGALRHHARADHGLRRWRQ